MKKGKIATLAMIGFSAALLMGSCPGGRCGSPAPSGCAACPTGRCGGNMSSQDQTRTYKNPQGVEGQYYNDGQYRNRAPYTLGAGYEGDFRGFYMSLSPEGQQKFDQLNTWNRKNAMDMANQQNMDPNTAVDYFYNQLPEGYLNSGCKEGNWQNRNNVQKDGTYQATGSAYRGDQNMNRDGSSSWMGNSRNTNSPTLRDNTDMNRDGSSWSSSSSNDADAFAASLSPESKRMFSELDRSHKIDAMKLVRDKGMDPNQAIQDRYNDQMGGSTSSSSTSSKY